MCIGLIRKTLAAIALPLRLHEFPRFQGSVLEDPSLSLPSVRVIEDMDVMPIKTDELISKFQLKKVTEGKEGFSFDFTEKSLKVEFDNTSFRNQIRELRKEKNILQRHSSAPAPLSLRNGLLDTVTLKS